MLTSLFCTGLLAAGTVTAFTSTGQPGLSLALGPAIIKRAVKVTSPLETNSPINFSEGTAVYPSGDVAVGGDFLLADGADLTGLVEDAPGFAGGGDQQWTVSFHNPNASGRVYAMCIPGTGL